MDNLPFCVESLHGFSVAIGKIGLLVFLNQIREKIGIVYGNPEVTSGGRALRFYASIRLDLRRKEALKDGDTIIGHTIKVKCTKNKVSTPFRETTINLFYET